VEIGGFDTGSPGLWALQAGRGHLPSRRQRGIVNEYEASSSGSDGQAEGQLFFPSPYVTG